MAAAAPIAFVTTAAPAGADCNYAGGSTVCAQGTVRGPDGVPRAATPVVPYPCDVDWYCGTEWDLNVDWDPGRPDRPGRGAVRWRRWHRTTMSNPDNMTRQPLDEGATMMSSARPTPIRGLIGAGAVSGAMLFGAAAIAAAQPPPPAPIPPPCTAAELARVLSGVTFDTSNYLTLHPDVNDFFTGLKGQPRDQIGEQVGAYFEANPMVQSELQAIRQPSIDFRNRCGAPGDPMMPMG